MYNGLKYAFIFVGGAAVGATVAWKLLKDTYARIAQEEIDSVKAHYAKKAELAENSEEDDSEYLVFEEEESPEVTAYNALTAEYESRGGLESTVKEPRVIAPDEFGETDYEQVSLKYWEDGVLTDDQNQLLEDVEGTVGWESLTHFGEYEDDAVHVRNDRLKCDYEILMEPGEFYATVSTNLNPSDN